MLKCSDEIKSRIEALEWCCVLSFFILEGTASQEKRMEEVFGMGRRCLLLLNYLGLWNKALSNCSKALSVSVVLAETSGQAQKRSWNCWRSQSSGVKWKITREKVWVIEVLVFWIVAVLQETISFSCLLCLSSIWLQKLQELFAKHLAGYSCGSSRIIL